MKKLFALLLILALAGPVAAHAEEPDPLAGGWYIMFDYKTYPGNADEFAGSSYMMFVLFFEDDGTVSGFSVQKDDNQSFMHDASKVGEWSNDNGEYTLKLLGVGTCAVEFHDGRPLIQMTQNIYYYMRRLEWGSWYDDLVVRRY